jgi:hypothetical protein
VKWLLKVGVTVLLVLLCLMAAAWLVSPSPIDRDPPRDLPWTLPDYRAAKTAWSIGPDGRIYNQVEHFFLEGISPTMVAWFYQQLPISTVEYRGDIYPLYHMFHPTEHGTLRVLEPAPDGAPGMSEGALIEREEWFGPYDSRGAARIVSFSDRGMLAIPVLAGMEMGSVRHTWKGVDGGTAYRVDAVIGSDLPYVGWLLNIYLRERVFHPAMLEQWQRHQVEEVSSLQFFLPGIYAQRGSKNHYLIRE